METRQITQVKIYVLSLNSMFTKSEQTHVVAISVDKDELMKWYESLKVEQYNEDRYTKIFSKDSVLSWYNPIEFTDYGGVTGEWMTKHELRQFVKLAKVSYDSLAIPILIGCEEIFPDS